MAKVISEGFVLPSGFLERILFGSLLSFFLQRAENWGVFLLPQRISHFLGSHPLGSYCWDLAFVLALRVLLWSWGIRGIQKLRETRDTWQLGRRMGKLRDGEEKSKQSIIVCRVSVTLATSLQWAATAMVVVPVLQVSLLRFRVIDLSQTGG